jgi:hypothetical protein
MRGCQSSAAFVPKLVVFCWRSEEGKSMSESAEGILDLRPREWVMLIFILLMLEAGILVASFNLRQDKNLIDFVSFAATIASLLLAVLAIIYGYYQSDSQQQSSAAVSAQLLSVSRVEAELAKTASDMVSHMGAISSMTTTLNSISATLDTKMSALEGNIADVHKQQKVLETALQAKLPLAQPVAGPSDVQTSARRLIRETSLQFDVFGVALLLAFQTAKQLEIPVWPFVQRTSLLLSQDKGAVTANQLEWFHMLTQFVFALRAFGFLTMHSDPNADKTTISITPPNLELLAALAAETRKAGALTNTLALLDGAAAVAAVGTAAPGLGAAPAAAPAVGVAGGPGPGAVAG